MNRIEIRNRARILSIIRNGFNENKMTYYGQVTEDEFWENFFNFKELKSTDSRFDSAYEDIWQHTINNDDWPDGWQFEYEPFNLKKCDDKKFLEFICYIFDPFTRKDNEPWHEILKIVNSVLNEVDYELYIIRYIANLEQYGWRDISSASNKNVNVEFDTSKQKVIGEGSYAIVSKFKVKEYNLFLVEKKLRKNNNNDQIVRFKNEYDILKKMSHPNIVAVYNFDKNKNSYIMEYLDTTLEEYIKKKQWHFKLGW